MSGEISYVNRIISSTSQPISHLEHGIGYQVFEAMKKYKSLIAQYDANSETYETYEDLLVKCISTALKLKSKCLNPDDLICICTHNHLNTVVPLLASLFIGQKICCLDPSLPKTTTNHLIKISKPVLFFVNKGSISLIENSLQENGLQAEFVIFDSNETEYEYFNNYLDHKGDLESFKPIKVQDLHETAVVLFSSGTTGFPKGICLNHKALILQAFISNGIIAPILTDKKVCLCYASFYWISAVLTLLGSCFAGYSRVICSQFNPVSDWKLINKFSISNMFLAPIQALAFCRAGRPKDINISSLKAIITGGAFMTEKQIAILKNVFPGVFISQGYGQTEVAGPVCCFRVLEDTRLMEKKLESCGRPLPGFQLKVVNPENDQLCVPYEHGELRIKFEGVMNGYLNQDSSEAFDSEGWLKTGDIVYYDSSYCFYIVDRIKDIFKYRSWHIAPAMIEKVLHEHPSVLKAVVIGIPHEEDGERPMAVVILKENKTATSKEIEEFVDKNLHDIQRLRAGVRFVQSLPLTPSLKVQRKHVRDMVLSGKI